MVKETIISCIWIYFNKDKQKTEIIYHTLLLLCIGFVGMALLI